VESLMSGCQMVHLSGFGSIMERAGVLYMRVTS
jgi:hypothetical protein